MRAPNPGGRGRSLILALVGAVAGAALVVVGMNLSAVVGGRPEPSVTPHARAKSKTVAPAQPIPTVAPTAVSATPTEIAIPAIGVKAAVEDVGLDSSGSMGVPTNINDTAWYEDGAAPGQAGDAVIDGHLDWYTGPAVFWNLAKVAPGEAITVTMSNDTQIAFTVRSEQSYPYATEPPGLFSTSGPPTLSLITCAGQWDAGKQIYSNRLVLTASPDQ